jgi:hypothetical protein
MAAACWLNPQDVRHYRWIAYGKRSVHDQTYASILHMQDELQKNTFMIYAVLLYKMVKGKAIPVTGRESP